MDTDLETLTTALYVTVDDLLIAHPHLAPPRPRVGLDPRTSDAEIITLALIQALLGHTSQRHWLRHARKHLTGVFPRIPGQSGFNKRLRALATTMSWLITALARSTRVWDDTLWLAETPPPSNAPAPAPPSSDPSWPGGPATGTAPPTPASCDPLRLHLVATTSGLPVAWALTSPSHHEREALTSMLNDLTPRPTRS